MIPLTADELRTLIAQGESETLEFKRSTAELTKAIGEAVGNAVKVMRIATGEETEAPETADTATPPHGQESA